MWLIVLAAFFLLFVPPGEAWAQRACSQFKAAITSVPVAAPVQRVAGIPGKRIYLCGWVLVPTPPSSGSNQVEFEITTGTGTDCATNRTTLIPRMFVPAGGLINRNPYASGETTAQGGAVCLQTWGTGSVTSIFYWDQF